MKNSTPATVRGTIVVLIAPAMLYGCWIGMLVAHVIHAGDARDMLRLGTPPWAMMLFGAVCTATGLWLWHDVRWLTRR